VVRSFTVLDGIGKSLDPRFDISEISAPYARELLLEARPQFSKVFDDLKRRSDKQVGGRCAQHPAAAAAAAAAACAGVAALGSVDTPLTGSIAAQQ
jgi:hypothetical protein